MVFGPVGYNGPFPHRSVRVRSAVEKFKENSTEHKKIRLVKVPYIFTTAFKVHWLIDYNVLEDTLHNPFSNHQFIEEKKFSEQNAASPKKTW